MPTSGVIRNTRLRAGQLRLRRALPRTGQSIHLSTLAAVQARNRVRKPVSVTYRTGLGYAETEIGKWRAETAAAKPPVQRRNSRICQPETRARQHNPRECRRFSHTRKSHSGDRTGWLGREDSNLRMAESKSAALPLGYAPMRHRIAARRAGGMRNITAHA